jgi:subtilase family serine protease
MAPAEPDPRELRCLDQGGNAMRRTRHPIAPVVFLGLLVLSFACGVDDGTAPPPPPPPDLPDLTVQGLTFDPESPQANQEVTATVTVQNVGPAPADSSAIRVEVDGIVSLTRGTRPLPSGNAVTVGCGLGFLAEGLHQVRVCADFAEVIREGSEADNCRSATLTVLPAAPLAPDLLIETIDFEPPSPSPSDAVTARVTVRNVGNQAAAGSSLRVEIGGEIACESVDTPAVPAGQAVLMSCLLAPRAAGAYLVRACADAAGDVSEEHENNNCGIDTLRVVAAAAAPATAQAIPCSRLYSAHVSLR